MKEEDQNTTIETQRSQSPASTDPEALSTAVRLQVEYYFSKENLRTDTFLQSKMDINNAVPLATVMAFPKILALTRETQVVIKSLESSTVVALVDGKIKPKGNGRSTIILREIPSDSSEESIREIFNYPGAKPISSVRSEIGDTWFVTMESEDDAKDAIMDLKLKKRCFNGTPVKARLKTDAGIRSYYTAGTVIPLAYPGMTFQPYGMVMEPPTGYNYEVPQATSPTSPQSKEKASSSYRKESSEGDGDNGGRRDGKERGSNRNSKNNNGSNRKQGGNGKGTGRDRKENPPSAPPPPPPIEINSAADFPPLPPHGHLPENNDQHVPSPSYLQQISSESGVIPPCGYQGPYTRYSIDDILQIVSGIKDAVLPSSIQLTEHSAALVTSPNTDLLLRQRTFSIDETREQMQLGRPVQREAVITGAVDYGSFIYGELDHSGHGDAAGEKKTATKAGGSWAGVLMKGGAPPPPSDSKPTSSSPTKAQSTTDKSSVPATASTPSGTKSEKKQNDKKGSKSQDGGAKKEAGGGPKQEGEGKKNRRRRAGSHGENSLKGEENDKSPAVPSSWGGRPTFANVLKQQEEAAAEAAAAAVAAGGSTTSTTPAAATPSSNPQQSAAAGKKQSSSNNAPPSNQQNNRNQGGQKNADKGSNNSKPHAQHSKKPMTNPDGTWVRDKLPPR